MFHCHFAFRHSSFCEGRDVPRPFFCSQWVWFTTAMFLCAVGVMYHCHFLFAIFLFCNGHGVPRPLQAVSIVQAVSTATTCSSLSKQVMSLVTTSTTALRGAATSLELAERRRGSVLSMRFLLCTARRSVDWLQTKVQAQSDGLAARNHSRQVHFLKISSADAEKRRGKTKKYHR